MNASPIEDSLSLWAFFRRWQQLDQAVGHQSVDLGAYFALLEALSNGLTLGNRNALRALCRTVLVKPHHKLDVFEREFAQIWLPTSNKKPIVTINPDRPSTQQNPQNDRPHAESPSPPIPKSDESPAEAFSEPAQKPEAPKHPKPTKTDPGRVAVRFDSMGDGDEIEAGWETKAQEGDFQLVGNYEPVEERSIWQQVRQLRSQTHHDSKRIEDLNATIERISQRGVFEGMVQKRPPRYEISVTLLLDRRGSMIPFHHLSDRLGQVIGEQPASKVRYFQNHFERLLFKTPFLTNPESVKTWENGLRPQSLVIIVSDAGAARGFYMPNRIEKTRRMLYQIAACPNVSRTVWLNPMPRDRWWATSAEDIAGLVPMFAFDETEIGAAIKTLNGQMSR